MIVDRVAERIVRDTFASCDVEIGGARPWDIQVKDRAFYRRLAINPSFELGESYMDDQWDCPAIDELLFRLFSSADKGSFERGWKYHLRNAWGRLANRQSRARAPRVAQHHYDKTPELFRRMLDDETMSYTCAYWRDGDGLGAAQQNKLRMICDKLELQEGETLLDIGCGFGGLAEFAAENYGARVLGITNSQMHWRMARERCAALPGVEFALLDYRELPSLGRRFDKVASIEMIEAVGPKNFAPYMEIVHRVLLPGGRFVIQAFISATSQYVCNEWFDRHIFPNGVSPSLAQLRAATAQSFAARPTVEDIGEHYAPTLLAWDERFERHWPELKSGQLSAGFDERFRRMWHFYLTCLAGVFRAKDLSLCQIAYARG